VESAEDVSKSKVYRVRLTDEELDLLTDALCATFPERVPQDEERRAELKKRLTLFQRLLFRRRGRPYLAEHPWKDRDMEDILQAYSRYYGAKRIKRLKDLREEEPRS